jgi:hypothetical protein
MSERDFNNLKTWMETKLYERGLSTNRFTLLTGNRITNATLFRWYSDKFRPNRRNPDKLQLVCDTLSKLPIMIEGELPWFEDVPLREALAQFTERPHTG